MPAVVRPCVPSSLLKDRPLKASKKDRFTRINSMVPLSRTEIKKEDVVEYIIPANTFSSATLKGSDQTWLEAKNPTCCVLL